MEKNKFLQKIKNTGLWQFSQKPMVQNSLIGTFYVIMVVVLLGGSIHFHHQSLVLDEVATRTIQSPVQARIENVEYTEKLRQEAEAQVKKSYQEDDSSLDDALNEINQFFRQLDIILDISVPAPAADMPMEGEIEDLQNQPMFSVPDSEKNHQKLLDDERVQELSYLSEERRQQEIEKMLLKYHQLFTGDVQEKSQVMASYLMGAGQDELIQLENLITYLVNITMSKPIT